jgi:hypothetical protein
MNLIAAWLCTCSQICLASQETVPINIQRKCVPAGAHTALRRVELLLCSYSCHDIVVLLLKPGGTQNFSTFPVACDRKKWHRGLKGYFKAVNNARNSQKKFRQLLWATLKITQNCLTLKPSNLDNFEHIHYYLNSSRFWPTVVKRATNNQAYQHRMYCA